MNEISSRASEWACFPNRFRIVSGVWAGWARIIRPVTQPGGHTMSHLPDINFAKIAEELMDHHRGVIMEMYCHCETEDNARFTAEVDEGHLIVRHALCGRQLLDEVQSILQMSAIRIHIEFRTDHTHEHEPEGIITIPGVQS